jgi:hypothetical protein
MCAECEDCGLLTHRQLQLPEVRETKERGVILGMQTEAPGFYWLGQPWLRNMGPNFLLGVAEDAKVLAEKLR